LQLVYDGGQTGKLGLDMALPLRICGMVIRLLLWALADDHRKHPSPQRPQVTGFPDATTTAPS
jgi:hypothetical protein